MKKEFIYFMCALILFSVGFLIGKTQNDNGRYTLHYDSNNVVVFDTTDGVSYVRTDGDFIKLDIKNATREEYKKK